MNLLFEWRKNKGKNKNNAFVCGRGGVENFVRSSAGKGSRQDESFPVTTSSTQM